MHGPYTYDGLKIGRRNNSWQKYFNVLYIDNPIGVGFSHAADKRAFDTINEDIGPNLLNLLQQFYSMFPEYKDNELYLTGISYATKYLAYLGNSISESAQMINFKGMFIASGVMDPIGQMKYADYLEQWGYINKRDKMVYLEREEVIKMYLLLNDSMSAFMLYNDFIVSFTGKSTLLSKTSGPVNAFGNIYVLKDPLFMDFLEREDIKNELHVKGVPLVNDTFINMKLVSSMAPTFLTSVKSIYQKLLGDYKIMIYQGQADIFANYPAMASVIDNLNWHGKVQFTNAEREIIFLNGELVGYLKSYSNLNFAMIMKAAHEIPSDQPEVTLKLLFNFTDYNRFL